MTTLPKAKKYRLRRSTPLVAEPPPGLDDALTAASATVSAGPLPATHDDDLFANDDDGFPDMVAPGAAGPAVAKASASAGAAGAPATTAESEIEAIRREGLTGRQLRMARRVAQKHGLVPESDYDAVRLLRRQGIDPLERSTMLELVIADTKPDPVETPANLPQTVPAPQLPSPSEPPRLPTPKFLGDEERASEIRKIQQDIMRRRRRKTLLLFTRLAFFVLLPTLIAGYYFFNIATPLYSTKSEFLIQKADGGGSSGLNSMFSGTQFATTQDSITVQSYLQSRDAMLRLDREVGFREVFSGPGIDPILRLPDDATNEVAYRLYQRMVKIGFDPTEGIVKMEVSAPHPETSAAFSRALIAYAEEQVDNLTHRLREDQMTGARNSFGDAEAKMQDAQQRVLDLQEKLGVLDPASETASLMSQISTFEVQLQEKKLALQQLLDNPRPNQARVDGMKGDIQRLQTLIGNLRSQLTQSGDNSASLARITGELRMAEADLATRQALMQQALAQLETARIEANRQVRYLSVGVSPVAPDEPSYPRHFEDTLLTMLVFAGIYLMVSLTASILREQVTA